MALSRSSFRFTLDQTDIFSFLHEGALFQSVLVFCLIVIAVLACIMYIAVLHIFSFNFLCTSLVD